MSDAARAWPDVAPDRRVIPWLIEHQAARLGDVPFVVHGDEVRTFASMRDRAASVAGTLAAAGIGHGDRVGVMAENRLEALDAFLACAWLGAIAVPVNTGSRGPQLEHVLGNAGVRALAVEAASLPQLDTVRGASSAARARLAPRRRRARGVARTPGRSRSRAAAIPSSPRPVGPGDTIAILYTSGTTGPSKGVCCPHAQFYWWGVNTAAALRIQPDDVLYTCLPLFHTNALNTFVQALLHGARFVLGSSLLRVAVLAASRGSRGDRHVPARRDDLDPRLEGADAGGSGAPRTHHARACDLRRAPGDVPRALRDRGRRGPRHDRDERRARAARRRAAARHDGARHARLRRARRRRGRRRGSRRRAGGARDAGRRAVRLRDRLLADARADRRRVAEPLVPLRRPRDPGPRRVLPLRRPDQGRHPSARRERLCVGGRAGAARPPGRRGRGRDPRPLGARRGRRDGLRDGARRRRASRRRT